ncbi:hypothetical protein HYW20_04360 [Candidatus Woesearchaeota archaeon]|nr:hypothetical protein [Candidatus Woesearchaeota archaeon]
MSRNLIICMVFVIFISLIPITYSNGGCMKLADDIFVQMSHAPHVPKVYERVSILFSFADKAGLISKEISGELRIMKGEEQILAKNFKIDYGVLDLKHEFKNAGIHEIFINFALGNKTYSPEDFVIEVIEDNKPNYMEYFVFLIIGFLIGILSAKFMGKKK